MELFWLWLFTVIATLQLGYSRERSIRIGGIFNQQSPPSDAEEAFKFAISKINRQTRHTPHITYDIQLITGDNSFEANTKVCSQLELGVASVFGPPFLRAATAVQSVLDEVDVPHIEARWNNRRDKHPISINLYPDVRLISKAISDVVVYYKWAKIAILYQNEDSLVRLQDTFKLSATKHTAIGVWQLRMPNFKPVLKDIKFSGFTHIVVDCDFDLVTLLLNQALEVQMLTSYFHYFFTTPDLHLLDLERFSEGDVNITGMTMINADDERVKTLLRAWRQHKINMGERDVEKQEMTTEVALLYDSVDVFSKAVRGLFDAQNPQVFNLSCRRPTTWRIGHSLYNQLKSIHNFTGLTGSIEFDEEGVRKQVNMGLLELNGTSLSKNGHWDPVNGIKYTRKLPSPHAKQARNNTGYFSLTNRTLIVTTILENPYVMEVKSEEGKVLTGNDRYEGFCVDLLREIARIQQFNYIIKLVPDGKYGAEVEPGVWNGMVNELKERRADLAVAPLTISYVRENVVDFAKPFMNTGISILYRVPESKNPGVFSFLSPLDFNIWLYMLLAFLGVSVMLFILARFTPYEWYNPHPCNPEYDMVENQFNLSNSLWFTFGGLMQQGSEVNPRALSTRVISGIWWFFSLILISSYTANLAAFLTVERMVSPIKDVDDLASQTEIEYGSVVDGSTSTFFKNSNIEIYKRMHNFMSGRTPSVYTKTTDAGIERVRNSKNYAFLLESTFNEYITARDCNLTQIGGLLDSKFYGIGTPLGAPYRDDITIAILQLQEKGQIQKFKTKWWYSDGKCDNADKKQEANALGFENIGGIFFVLIGGLVIGSICALGEFVWKSKQNAELDRKSVCAEMGQELTFAIRCRTKKPLHGEIEEKYIEMTQTVQGGGQRNNLNQMSPHLKNGSTVTMRESVG